MDHHIMMPQFHAEVCMCRYLQVVLVAWTVNYQNQGNNTMVLACMCGMYCIGQGHLSSLWGRILLRKIRAQWCLCTQLPELQLQLWLANLFLDGTRFLSVNINTQLMYWIIATCNQMMSFNFVIQLTHRLVGPRGVLCHPDWHGVMVSPPPWSKLFDKGAMKNIHKEQFIYHEVTAGKIVQQG